MTLIHHGQALGHASAPVRISRSKSRIIHTGSIIGTISTTRIVASSCRFTSKQRISRHDRREIVKGTGMRLAWMNRWLLNDKSMSSSRVWVVSCCHVLIWPWVGRFCPSLPKLFCLAHRHCSTAGRGNLGHGAPDSFSEWAICSKLARSRSSVDSINCSSTLKGRLPKFYPS